jgi:hypothetical protein
MSRTPNAPQGKLEELADYALRLGLNKNNLKRQVTEQNCWNQLLHE